MTQAMRILVTGGAGFIGSNVALALQKAGHEVLVIDNMSVGRMQNLDGFEGTVIEEDIRKFDWLKSGVNAVVHQAAITGVVDNWTGEAVSDDAILAVNHGSSQHIFEFCTRRNIPFVYASSAAVYGMALAPQKESDAGKPTNAYGTSKWLFDQHVSVTPHENLVVGLRYFNVFGPGERFKGKLASMVGQLLAQMQAGTRPRIFKHGEQKRDQVYIKDAVAATLQALDAPQSCIVNVGSGCAVTFNEVVAALNVALGTTYEPEYIDNPYAHFFQTHTQADLAHARACLGYEPQWKFETAVNEYVQTECMC